MKEIRRKLMALMKEHQMGITEFAEKCGMEEGRLERILHSRGRLTPAEAVKIAAAFGQTMEEAFDTEPLPMDEVREIENTEFHKMVTEHLNTIAKIHKTTPSEFAEQCGLTERRVKNLLDGTARMSVVEAVKVVDGFNVSLDYLLGYYPYPLPTPKTEEQVRVYEAIGKMSLDELNEFAEKLKEELPQDES